MFVIIWICLGIVGAMIANNKGNSGCGGFILGVLLGPIGLLIAIFSSDNENVKRERTGHTKKCPYCAEYVKYDAIVCKHCGRSLDIDSDFDIDKFRVNYGNSDEKYYNDKKQSETVNLDQVEKEVDFSKEIPLKDHANSAKRIGTIIYIVLFSIIFLVICLIQYNRIKELKYQYPFGWFNFQHKKIDSALLANNIASIYNYQFRVDKDRKAKFLVACRPNDVDWEYYVMDLNKDKFHKVNLDKTLNPPLKKPSRQTETNDKQIQSKSTQNKSKKTNYSNKISSYALDPYTMAGYPETLKEFGSRIDEIERYRRKAAELAIEEYGCGFVEIVELSTTSTIRHLVFFVDCDNYKKRVLLSEDEIDKLYKNK